MGYVYETGIVLSPRDRKVNYRDRVIALTELTSGPRETERKQSFYLVECDMAQWGSVRYFGEPGSNTYTHEEQGI